jgi:hypothetical protein
MIYQCPDCELKFGSNSELDEHIAEEHPDFSSVPRSVEDAMLGAARRKRKHVPKYPPDYKVTPDQTT